MTGSPAHRRLVAMARHNLAHVGLRQQRALATGAKRDVLFGRNEGDGQLFHRFVEELIGLDDAALVRAFPRPVGAER